MCIWISLIELQTTHVYRKLLNFGLHTLVSDYRFAAHMVFCQQGKLNLTSFKIWKFCLLILLLPLLYSIIINNEFRKTMMADSFGTMMPEMVTAGFMGTFVALMGAANLGGRIMWSSLSDILVSNSRDKLPIARSHCLFFFIKYYL